VDWKPERAIQAKVRDFQKKSMTAEAHQWRNTLRWSTNSVFFQTFGSTMDFVPKRHQLLPSTGFYPVCSSVYSQKHHLQGSLPSVCTTMSVYLSSYIFCLVSSSSSVMCNYTVVQSSTVHTVIQITLIHTFILSYIHTLILSHINAYTTHTWYQFLHGSISHPSLVWSYPFSSVLTYHCVKRIACNYLFVTPESG